MRAALAPLWWAAAGAAVLVQSVKGSILSSQAILGREASREAPASGRHVLKGAPKSYTLRLCNAYAWPAPVEMRRLQEPKLVEDPLPYKQCHDYKLPLAEGDELEFRAGDLLIGTFSVKGLPPAGMLLLIPHRKERTSMAVAFESHIFSSESNPQAALVDAYGGRKRGSVMLREMKHQQELPFNSVVSLAPGYYEVNLLFSANSTKLNAMRQEHYTIFRVGDDTITAHGVSYPEELVVYPKSSGVARSAAALGMLGLLHVLSLHLLAPAER